MPSRLKLFAATIFAIVGLTTANAQSYYDLDTTTTVATVEETDTVVFLPWFDEEFSDDYCRDFYRDTVIIDRWRYVKPLPEASYRRPVFDTWRYIDSIPLEAKRYPEHLRKAYEWIDDINNQNIRLDRARQNFFVNNPDYVTYNIAWLPEDLASFSESVNATPTRVKLEGTGVKDTHRELAQEILAVDYKDWIQSLSSSVQFSQAYVSPNWYQGGSNSLIMLINAVYNVKLNQKFHPKLLFETTVSYKLGTNSAPDDTVRSYNVSEDLFQINSTFGYKAMEKWYYSLNLQFKTQIFNSYKSNSTDLKSAFLSRGELNLGLGMTYNNTNAKNTFSCDASIAPLSWQLTTCINDRIDETGYDIKPGRNCVNQFGSSINANITWKLAYNITYSSHLFAFSDYERFYGDWEHTLAFRINRYLTTQIYAHMRYDTSTPRCDDPSWHKFQVKEVLSFGFAYTLDTF